MGRGARQDLASAEAQLGSARLARAPAPGPSTACSGATTTGTSRRVLGLPNT